MGLGWIPISPLPVSYPCFKIGENPNPHPNLIKAGKTVKMDLVGWIPADMGFVVMPLD